MKLLESVRGKVVDLDTGTITPARLEIESGRIARVEPCDVEEGSPYILPGFVDAHVHVESSMLPPSAFARLAVVHGTVATVSDPHEIANVLGVDGVRYMLEDADKVPLKITFGAPSCVPATEFETAGARLGVEAVEALLDDPRIGYLSEVMNFPGVLGGDPELMAKIQAAIDRRKPVDGHAPGLRGELVERYASAGITTDHECVTLDEALDKIAAGMFIAIREGSAARNLEALMPLLTSHPERCFLCTDDSHPDDLIRGHINAIARRAIAAGHAPMSVLKAACVNPVRHYGLDVGLLQVGDPADFIEVDSLEGLNVFRTVIQGQVVAESGAACFPDMPSASPNRFETSVKTPTDFEVAAEGSVLRVIEARDGQLTTGELRMSAKIEGGLAVTDVGRDLLKLTVVNRYGDTPAAVAFIKNFGLKRGAIASSVAHDSHNVLGVGTGDEALCTAVNAVIEAGGGLSVYDGEQVHVLPLPIAGLMSAAPGEVVGAEYERLTQVVRGLGATLRAPFMTLSFMALLVIPDLKLSDRGLFSGAGFEFVDLFVSEGP